MRGGGGGGGGGRGGVLIYARFHIIPFAKQSTDPSRSNPVKWSVDRSVRLVSHFSLDHSLVIQSVSQTEVSQPNYRQDGVQLLVM